VTPLARVENLAAGYGGPPVISHISFELQPGERIGVLGPNGGGKSTLFHALLGELEPITGTIALGARVGFVPQTERSRLDYPVSALDVALMGTLSRVPWWRPLGRHERHHALDALDRVGLAGVAHEQFGELSGGQRQRGLLARALASEPALLLLDEPFNGLDQANRDALIATLHTLKAQGVAVLVSTHDLELAKLVCDAVVLVNGTQLAFGPVDDVLTLANVQECFEGVEVEIDEHTLVVPGHEGH
jgi:zinc/manganese transport system ATP-binding protein